MNSPSRQCDFAPLELPFTQFLYDVDAPPLMPLMATDAAAVLDPMQGSGDSGDTWPLVHWSRLAAAVAAPAGWASRSAGVASPATMAAMVSPCSNRRTLSDGEKV